MKYKTFFYGIAAGMFLSALFSLALASYILNIEKQENQSELKVYPLPLPAYSYKLNYKNSEIYFIGQFDERERNNVTEMLAEVKQGYLNNVRRIYFRKDECGEGISGTWTGYNKSGFIEVCQMDKGNLDSIKETLCHEILHSQGLEHGGILDDLEADICYGK